MRRPVRSSFLLFFPHFLFFAVLSLLLVEKVLDILKFTRRCVNDTCMCYFFVFFLLCLDSTSFFLLGVLLLCGASENAPCYSLIACTPVNFFFPDAASMFSEETSRDGSVNRKA